MESTTTRIMDLPIQPIQPEKNTPKIPDGVQTNYVAINNHPNPYGVPNTQHTMDHPEMAQSPNNNYVENMHVRPDPPGSQYLDEDQQNAIIASQSQQRLPSRDIPMDPTQYSNDEQIHTNYVPKSILKKDYVRNEYDMSDRDIQSQERAKKQQSRFETMIHEFQVPIILSLLYFLFQLPVVNAQIFKKFSFLSIYDEDGNFNIYGLGFKSMLFGSIYYTFMNFFYFLMEI
jgi:hypothetical protein|uniref:Uncharacterized protein n=1 Tax=viral metagenome TaxID=1070528 RepID=A0A6C0IKJ4_9ZZZZ